MRRAAAWLPWLLLVMAGACRAEGAWSGTWETHWRGGGGQVSLHQDGGTVEGEFPLYRAHVTGTASGTALEGQWSGAGQAGRFHLELGSDGRSFIGRGGPGDWWTGERVQPEAVAAPAGGATSPRAAFAAFLVAANQARDGQEDAWAAALAQVDFAAAGVQASPTRPVHLAAQLFDLIDLTTFEIGIVPDAAPGPEVTFELPQPDTGAALTLTMHRDGTGAWRLAMPGDAALAASRKALLAGRQGHAPAADAFRRLGNPRDTMRTFLLGMSNWDADDGALALSTLNLHQLPEIVQHREGVQAARYLRRALDRIGMTGLQSIPDDGADRAPYVHFVHRAGKIVIAPAGPEADAAWQFTPQTVASIDNVFQATESLPPPSALPPGQVPPFAFFRIRDGVRSYAPALLGRVGHFAYWQLIAYPVLMLLLFGVAVGASRAFSAVVRRVLRQSGPAPRAFAWSLTVLLLFALLLPLIDLLSLPISLREFSAPLTRALACLLGSVVAWHLLRMIAARLAHSPAHRGVSDDDILASLLLTAAQFAVVIAGTVGAAYFLAIPAANIVAGIGIGGLAVAFASRETLSNIFGAGILVSDRPFRRGDWIKSGDVEGVIEQVGIWSTRIRTVKDSVMVVPNGKLIDSNIDNMGRRRHRLMETRLVVTAGATPEKLDGFTAAVRGRIADHPLFVTDRTTINVADFNEFGVVISLVTYLDVTDTDAEQHARHALMLDIFRMAQASGLQLGTGMPGLTGAAAEH